MDAFESWIGLGMKGGGTNFSLAEKLCTGMCITPAFPATVII